MAKSIGGLEAWIGLDNRRLAADAAVSRSIFAGVGKAAIGMAVGLAAVAGATGAAATLASTAREGVNFGKEIAVTSGIMRASREEMDAVRESALHMGETTERTATQAAGALYFLASSGYDAAQSIAALPGVLDLSTAGNVELAESADIAVNALRSMSLGVEETGRVSDVLYGTVSRTNTDLRQLAEAFRYAAPVANAFGYSIEETSGMLGQLANAGVKGSMAGTQLAMAIQRSADIAKDMNLESSDLVDVLAELRNRGTDATQMMDLFGIRGGRAALIIKGLTGETRDLQNALYATGGETKRQAETMRGTLWGMLKELESVVEGIKLAVFDEYKESLRALVQETIGWLRAHKDEIVAVAGTISRAFLSVAEAIGELTGGIWKFGSLIVDFFTVDVHNAANEAKRSIREVGDATKDTIEDIAAWYKETTETGPPELDAGKTAWRSFGRIAENAYQAMKAVAEFDDVYKRSLERATDIPAKYELGQIDREEAERATHATMDSIATEMNDVWVRGASRIRWDLVLDPMKDAAAAWPEQIERELVDRIAQLPFLTEAAMRQAKIDEQFMLGKIDTTEHRAALDTFMSWYRDKWTEIGEAIGVAVDWEAEGSEIIAFKDKVEAAWRESELPKLMREAPASFAKATRESGASLDGLTSSLRDLRELPTITISDTLPDEIRAQAATYQTILNTGATTVAELNRIWGDYYDAQMRMARLQAEEWRRQNVDAMQIQRYMAGVRLQLDQEYLDRMKKFHKKDRDTSVTLAEETAKGMTRGFQEFFFDAMKLEFKSLRDYVNTIMDDIRRIIARRAAESTQRWIEAGLDALFPSYPGGATVLPSGEAIAVEGADVGPAVVEPNPVPQMRPMAQAQSISSNESTSSNKSVVIHVHGVRDAASFRRARAQIANEARMMLED